MQERSTRFSIRKIQLNRKDFPSAWRRLAAPRVLGILSLWLNFAEFVRSARFWIWELIFNQKQSYWHLNHRRRTVICGKINLCKLSERELCSPKRIVAARQHRLNIDNSLLAAYLRISGHPRFQSGWWHTSRRLAQHCGLSLVGPGATWWMAHVAQNVASAILWFHQKRRHFQWRSMGQIHIWQVASGFWLAGSAGSSGIFPSGFSARIWSPGQHTSKLEKCLSSRRWKPAKTLLIPQLSGTRPYLRQTWAAT